MEEALRKGEEARLRDPRQATFGFLARGEFVQEGTEVFMWFESLNELVAHLQDVEPVLLTSLVVDFDTEAYRDRIRIPLDQALRQGLDEGSRLAFNEAADGLMIIDWWGTFADLQSGDSRTSRELLSWFRAPGAPTQDTVAPLSREELEEFVGFVRFW